MKIKFNLGKLKVKFEINKDKCKLISGLIIKLFL
ncbi:hypothetical protein C621_0205650 [Bacillus thuringiensis serovar aizawai str. Leapi01]|nr:hypothetical protein C621_0205650 [Bacillus thuringiensis serovar aizawai str. Leapi01]ETE96909.1 hypothetical protein C623_0216980 [Bacillus thuringiensis serovar aizawai str. Hu4-2]